MTPFLEDVDVVHLHDPRLVGSALHFARHRYSRAIVMSTHGAFFHTKRLRSAKLAYFGAIASRVVRRFNLVIANSASDAAMFKRITDKVVSIENGINFDKFNVIAARPPGCAHSIVYFGRLALNKGLDRLLDCIRNLHGQMIPIVLNIVGEGHEAVDRRLKERAMRLNVADLVHFHGPLADAQLLEVIAQSRFFVSASEYEGFGLSAVEAMAAGKVVLLSRIPPFERLVMDGVDGFLVDFSATDRGAARIAEIVRLPSLRLDTIAERAKERARSYSWQAKIPEFIAAYEAAQQAAKRETPD